MRAILAVLFVLWASPALTMSSALGPLAHSKFCLAQPLDCEVSRPRSEPSAAQRIMDRAQINQTVNQKILPDAFPDGPVRSAATERWLIWPERGDCNDYAVTKQHELLRRGWPSRMLLLAVVFIPETSEYHLVLIADGIVMDNRTKRLVPLAQTNYTLVRIQSALNPKFWEKPE